MKEGRKKGKKEARKEVRERRGEKQGHKRYIHSHVDMATKHNVSVQIHGQ